MRRNRVLWVALGVAVALGTMPTYGTVMGTQDLLNGAGSVDTEEQQAAWTMSTSGETGLADFLGSYYGSNSPHGIRLQSTWRDPPTKGQ